ncbi:Uncharacterised protein [Salmonella enterica subsp. enterica serovar Bovismorbificans]|uniref:Uncharacterized protein n=1 Tax=Salmonella enterica subsp. enterica serovar Bovismorbificans TaxID=58097 RepID=A0A655BP10_SALET|nr:Uncharacterised protein [Salmonella enterica subsp. enterica serovar Bovismorbificans]CNT64163.1 Uncharacterised protein [Salmonella enterica subsp. enterica serovar Bovismorbificans]
MLCQRPIQRVRQFGKALQPQTAANSEQSMMKIFTIRLPTGFIAVGVGEVVMHTDEILFTQSFQTKRKRIFHYRNGGLRHSFA